MKALGNNEGGLNEGNFEGTWSECEVQGLVGTALPLEKECLGSLVKVGKRIDGGLL